MTGFVTDRFRRALDHLLVLEGGFSDHSADRGGKTKYGISQKSYPLIAIASLTRDDATQIYHRDFWTKLKCDDIRPEAIAAAVFEMGVHAGIGTGAKLLQRAVNALGKPLPVDGKIGPATLALVNALPPAPLLEAFRRECLHHYAAIIDRDPSQKIFWNGWRNRIYGTRPPTP